MNRNHIEISVNGLKKRVSGEQAFLPLSSWLRYQLLLTGTKVVCAEGDCGACTVMVARKLPDGSRRFISINSCIAMTYLMDRAEIITVEGLKEEKGLCEVQNSMVRNFGGQCGFCTPGFVMSLTNLYEQKTKVNPQQVKNSLTGNLCRCTGYAPIVEAGLDVDVTKHRRLISRYPAVDFDVRSAVKITLPNQEFYAPLDLASACQYKKENAEVVIFSGSTDLGVRYNKGQIRPQKVLSLHLIPELYHSQVTDDEVMIGSKVTLAQFEELMKEAAPRVSQFLHIFASPQIKNAATLVGNLANASPIADTTPVMMALDAELEIFGTAGKRTVALKEFYLGYKKLDLKQDEIITAVRFKRPKPDEKMENYKVSQRRDLDISCVNASFLFSISKGVIEKARISYGGVGPTTLRLTQIENEIQGKRVSSSLVEETKKKIVGLITPMSDARGSAQFRSLLAANLFEKFAQEHMQA